MAELFVAPIVGKLLEKAIDGLICLGQHILSRHQTLAESAEASTNQISWLTKMNKELERLRDNYSNVTVVASAARRAQTNDQNSKLNEWIWKLRDAIDEADDLFDDLEYMNHQQHDYWENLIKLGESALETDPILKRLVEVVQKLDKISADVSIFLHLLENIKQEQREQQDELHTTRETGSFPTNALIGRGEYKESVIDWLRKQSDEEPQTHATTAALYRNISLLSIVGHGGMGKTTLLQHVYEDEFTEEFDLKIWVCVSDNFDVQKVIADMLESVNDHRPSLQSLPALQKSLKSKMMTKKFLLVLDDIWDDKEEEEAKLMDKWRKVLAPLAYGGLGSKILITTRTDSAASMIAKVIGKKNGALRLGGLKEDECLQLLTIHAFADADNLDDHKKLKSIIGELVKKLHGCPLAAKVMGGVLNSSLNETHWRNVLNSSLGLYDIFPILKLSYIFLPEHLQSCFSFCSIFKQDHLFDKNDLVRMWIAVGFIQPSHIQGETLLTLEDIGESYFDVLVKKSFFEKVVLVKNSFSRKVTTDRYKMHDLLHELAQSVSEQECFRFVGDEMSQFLKIPETIRHLSVETSNPEVLKKAERFKNLRTLHITNEYDSNLADVLRKIFLVIKSIRLFHLNYNFVLKIMPEEIENLQHLRYLRFSVLNVELLPRSLSSLYNLQFIIFDHHEMNSYSKDFFPRDMNNLFNLRYVTYSKLNFPRIRKLKFLQELKEFKIKNEDGYRIEELEHMNDLRYLDLTNLNKVRDAEETYNAKLRDKRKLTHLYLCWGEDYLSTVRRHSGDSDLDERVLDNLQPHNYLKTLNIHHYMGARSAIWMNEAHTINNLEEIKLYDCFEWENLPPFGQLPFLKTLHLWNMPKVKRIENKFHGNDMQCVFPSLQKLCIYDMEALVDWFDASVFEVLFPCLTELRLQMCPNLQELPYLPPKLESLYIENIGWKTLNCCGISKSIPLTLLHVRKCPNLTSISPCVFPSLQYLHIENMEALVDWFDASVVDDLFPCLIELWLVNCPNLQELPYLPPKLESLKIEEIGWKTLNICSISKSIPLQTLQVRKCPNITSISVEGEIGKLEKLIIERLQSLQSLPCSLTNIIASVEFVELAELPQLQEYPDLPLPFRQRKLKEPKLHMTSFSTDNENGLRFEGLEHMNEIHKLSIFHLNNVRDAQEAYNAKLCDKRKLIHLFLNWDTDLFNEYVDRDLAERVLDNLQPHNYLKTLEIYHYVGARSARWMNKAHLINNLQVIKLGECLEWEILPPIGQLPFLKTLKLFRMPKVKRLENKFHGNDMHCVFPSLQKLDLYEMEALVDWFDASVVDGFFPCLTELRLSHCPNLQELPYLPPKLESLDICKIGWKTLNCCSISKSIPLTSLKVWSCPNLTSISPCVFPSLQKLDLYNMEALVDWFDASVVDGFFPCLTELRLFDCPNLQELPYLPPKLESLDIHYIGWKTLNCCSISKSIPLQRLNVFFCPNMTSISLEGEIEKLENLTIEALPSLESFFPSSLANVSSLKFLKLVKLPQLQEYPDLPLSLKKIHF